MYTYVCMCVNMNVVFRKTSNSQYTKKQYIILIKIKTNDKKRKFHYNVTVLFFPVRKNYSDKMALENLVGNSKCKGLRPLTC